VGFIIFSMINWKKRRGPQPDCLLEVLLATIMHEIVEALRALLDGSYISKHDNTPENTLTATVFRHFLSKCSLCVPCMFRHVNVSDPLLYNTPSEVLYNALLTILRGKLVSPNSLEVPELFIPFDSEKKCSSCMDLLVFSSTNLQTFYGTFTKSVNDTYDRMLKHVNKFEFILPNNVSVDEKLMKRNSWIRYVLEFIHQSPFEFYGAEKLSKDDIKRLNLENITDDELTHYISKIGGGNSLAISVILSESCLKYDEQVHNDVARVFNLNPASVPHFFLKETIKQLIITRIHENLLVHIKDEYKHMKIVNAFELNHSSNRSALKDPSTFVDLATGTQSAGQGDVLISGLYHLPSSITSSSINFRQEASLHLTICVGPAMTASSTPSSDFNLIVSLHRNSVFFNGRYCKYSRTLSQSPWLADNVPGSARRSKQQDDSNINDQINHSGINRTLPSSVEDAICLPIKHVFIPKYIPSDGSKNKSLIQFRDGSPCVCLDPTMSNNSGNSNSNDTGGKKLPPNFPFSTSIITKFHAAGREDVDVRMLGDGRPFLMEIINCSSVLVPVSAILDEIPTLVLEYNQTMRLIDWKVPSVGSSYDFRLIEKGAKSKRKLYTCVCWSKMKLSKGDLVSKIDQACIDRILVDQQTPIRVLHRRSLLTRKKVIYKLTTEWVSEHIFLLHVLASAGTYIKEFVHGDSGRTKPSISSLLDGPADILQLDVVDLLMTVNDEGKEEGDEDEDAADGDD
jgi:tRNA U54 and U55 pseudouridine synthase Pus10